MKQVRESTGKGYESFAKYVLSGEVAHSTIRDIETGKSEARLSTLLRVCEFTGADKHELAHLAFMLPPPEDMMEFGDQFADCIAMYKKLSEKERGMVLRYMEEKLEGGDARALLEAAEPEAGYG